MKFQNFCSTIITLSILVVLNGCQPSIHNQGKKIDDDELSQIQKGVNTKSDVLQILGSPSIVSSFADNKWYYVYKQTKTRAFLKPDVLEQDVVTIEFGPNEVISNIKILDEKKGKEVEYVDRVTPTAGHSASFLNQVFGDFGRVAKKDDSK